MCLTTTIRNGGHKIDKEDRNNVAWADTNHPHTAVISSITTASAQSKAQFLMVPLPLCRMNDL